MNDESKMEKLKLTPKEVDSLLGVIENDIHYVDYFNKRPYLATATVYDPMSVEKQWIKTSFEVINSSRNNNDNLPLEELESILVGLNGLKGFYNEIVDHTEVLGALRNLHNLSKNEAAVDNILGSMVFLSDIVDNYAKLHNDNSRSHNHKNVVNGIDPNKYVLPVVDASINVIGEALKNIINRNASNFEVGGTSADGGSRVFDMELIYSSGAFNGYRFKGSPIISNGPFELPKYIKKIISSTPTIESFDKSTLGHTIVANSLGNINLVEFSTSVVDNPTRYKGEMRIVDLVPEVLKLYAKAVRLVSSQYDSDAKFKQNMSLFHDMASDYDQEKEIFIKNK